MAIRDRADGDGRGVRPEGLGGARGAEADGGEEDEDAGHLIEAPARAVLRRAER